MWIEAYLQDVLVSPEQRIKPELPKQKVIAQQQEVSRGDLITQTEIDQRLVHPNLSKPLRDGQPFVSLLLEVSQGLRLPSPEFEFQQEEGYFICSCRFEAMGQQFVGEGSATKKQQAKHLAARVVLEQLQEEAGIKEVLLS
jgi:dsRNA-specific ribonuclease